MYGIEREKKAGPQNSRRKTPMQKSCASENAKTAVENAHFVRVENKPQPPSFEVGNTVSDIFLVGNTRGIDYSFIAPSENVKNLSLRRGRGICRSRNLYRWVSPQKSPSFVRESSRPWKTVGHCRPCLPEGGGRRKKSMPATLDVGARQDEQLQ